MHAALDRVVPHVLKDRPEEPGELGVVGGVGHEEGEDPEEALHLLGFERLVAPGPHALQPEAVLVHAAGTVLQDCRLLGERRRRREEGGG